jgi:hypothetical protein
MATRQLTKGATNACKRRQRCLSGKAQFDLEGDALRGPAEDALLRYPLRREGEALVIEV